MRVAFIGCVEASETALETVLSHPDAEVVGVVTRAASAFNADFRSLEPVARRHGVPVFLAEGNAQQAMTEWVGALAPDVVYCFGWSYLLGAELLALPRLGVIGYHPAALPQNRGRHPIIWALALGLDSTASTFFFMDEGADSGDILSQRPVAIRYEDDARALYERLKGVATEQIAEFTTWLAAGSYPRRPQDHTRANYWRKRSRTDGRIDWRMSPRRIYDLVRALSEPYPGSHFDGPAGEVKVWRVEEARAPFAAEPNLEPGRILSVEEDAFFVKCGDGAVRLVDWDRSFEPETGICLT